MADADTMEASVPDNEKSSSSLIRQEILLRYAAEICNYDQAIQELERVFVEFSRCLIPARAEPKCVNLSQPFSYSRPRRKVIV